MLILSRAERCELTCLMLEVLVLAAEASFASND